MQRAHERIMLNITWRDHKTTEWIRKQTKLRDILETISKAKWTWAGHLTRRTDNRWTTKLTFWQPRGHTRNKGRPKFRWRDDLDKFCKHWHRDASDRLRWRQMGKAYVQLRTFKGWPDRQTDSLRCYDITVYIVLSTCVLTVFWYYSVPMCIVLSTWMHAVLWYYSVSVCIVLSTC